MLFFGRVEGIFCAVRRHVGRIPFYYELKILFMLWLLSPATKGSSIIYRKLVHPQLNRRESVRDYSSSISSPPYHPHHHHIIIISSSYTCCKWRQWKQSDDNNQLRIKDQRINSASYPQRDAKWVPDKGQFSAAGKVTVGSAAHYRCFTDSVVYFSRSK